MAWIVHHIIPFDLPWRAPASVSFWLSEEFSLKSSTTALINRPLLILFKEARYLTKLPPFDKGGILGHPFKSQRRIVEHSQFQVAT